MEVLRALERIGEPVATRAQLLRAGATPRAIAAAVFADRILRVRRGYYCLPTADPSLIRAVRIGGRLGCISAAQELGIWSAEPTSPHVAMRHSASRLRSPADRFTALTTENRDGCELHWFALPELPRRNIHTVSAIEALAHIVQCQPRKLAIASIDSALFQLAVTPLDVHRMFEGLPRRLRRLESHVDGRCMSGIESLVRLLLLDAGIPFELQVSFRGVGTVDFVVAGRVIVEIDGRLGHADEPSRARDYRRDAAVIRLGYAVVRLDYAQVMFDPEGALATIVAAIASHSGARTQR
jgi:very-short-patch-repair endonuclease